MIQWNFKLLTMSFSYGHKQVLLQGLKSANSQLQDGETFLKQSVKKGLILQILVQLKPQLLFAEEHVQSLDAIAALLLDYKSIFATPEGLPPLRDHEHHINLKEGAQFVS